MPTCYDRSDNYHSSARAGRPGLVVLDTAFGVVDQAIENPAIRRVLWIQAKEQLSRLVLLCNTNKIPLLLNNGVGYKPGADQERPFFLLLPLFFLRISSAPALEFVHGFESQ